MSFPIYNNVPTRALLAGEPKGSFARLLASLNIKRNLTSMFVNRYLPYFALNYFTKLGVERFQPIIIE